MLYQLSYTRVSAIIVLRKRHCQAELTAASAHFWPVGVALFPPVPAFTTNPAAETDEKRARAFGRPDLA